MPDDAVVLANGHSDVFVAAVADTLMTPEQSQDLAATAVQELGALAEEQQQQQQQFVLATQPKQQVPQPAMAPIQVHATAALQPRLSRLQVAVPAPDDSDVFYDAQELPTGELVMHALLKELQQAQLARQEANRYGQVALQNTR